MPSVVGKTKKVPSLSSASTTKSSPEPWCALLPDSFISEPITNEGSFPAFCKMTVTIEVVVVFP